MARKKNRSGAGVGVRIAGLLLLVVLAALVIWDGGVREKALTATQLGLLVLLLAKQGCGARVPQWQVWLYAGALGLVLMVPGLVPQGAVAGDGLVAVVYVFVFAAADTVLTGMGKRMADKLDEWDKSDEP